ncbi:protein phosphatase methylesterase 1 [Exophiala aquamarina CBS 119918]|uniref:Protein phosphatase methylesterase 1 n=1 Tax=Exophiala aquamarina CBS 119918 TaxID=1182545 RepID=A0A072PE89_9EURO|nr:protein phosphatase methylesterase 1 [Exophiala aquamarina CBS 119918]KEF58166.1 protein phosphatase methylesterase 1 [Exophiala aquamarina CBS 119918]
MSDLQRSFAKTHLSKLPPEPPPILNEDDELQDQLAGLRASSPNDSSSSASSASSTGTIVPSASQNLFEKPRGSAIKSRSAPLPWDDFFAQDLTFERQTSLETIRHHAYLTPPSSKGPLIVTHHGAGSSGLSFAAFTAELLKLLPNAGVLSLDARGHGLTSITPAGSVSGGSGAPQTLDLSLKTLAEDLSFIVEAVKAPMKWATLPDIVLIGHSLGGAVVTEVAHQRLLGSSLLAYGVLDVVEGSAMDALQSMDTYLSTRPKSFPSLASGIEWHTRSRTIRNTTSARVSVPSLLTESADSKTWTWRTDLAATKPFWEDWFVGLSKKFLESRGGKLLLLAGTDRLDKELMIGQMQGKYQLQVFPEAGHFLHEDQPARTATVVCDFYRRNDRTAFVMPPKVDDLIRQGKLKPPPLPGASRS